MSLLDLHTHRPAPYPQGIISTGPQDFSPCPGQLYSLGLHPWYLPSDPDRAEELMRRLEQLAGQEQVAAIGEAGLDARRGAPMWLQIIYFKRQVELSERLAKPLIIHNVKSNEALIAIHTDMEPRQPWIVHGFRQRPQVAEMLLKHGMALSFSEKFNAESLRLCPPEALFAETDESSRPISEIIESLSEARGYDLLPIIKENMQRLLLSEI